MQKEINDKRFLYFKKSLDAFFKNGRHLHKRWN